MNQLLTIVIPVFNRAKFLQRTLASVAANDAPFQLLLVDNGSSDGSLDICKKFAAENAQAAFEVKVLEETKAGAAAARNCGLEACQSEFIYFFDSDDEMSADFASKIIDELKRASEVDLLAVPVHMEVNGKTVVRSYEATSRAQAHILNNMLGTHSMIFRTEWLREIGGWDATLKVWNDWELGVRTLLAHPRMRWFTNDVFHHITVHNESLTSSSFSSTLEATLTSMYKALKDIDTASIADAERSTCKRALYLRAYIMAGNLLREKNPEGVKAYIDAAKEIMPHPSKPIYMLARMLKTYVGAGGRGAWRIALQAV